MLLKSFMFSIFSSYSSFSHHLMKQDSHPQYFSCPGHFLVVHVWILIQHHHQYYCYHSHLLLLILHLILHDNQHRRPSQPRRPRALPPSPCRVCCGSSASPPPPESGTGCSGRRRMCRRPAAQLSVPHSRHCC